jgi:hypothetical protein
VEQPVSGGIDPCHVRPGFLTVDHGINPEKKSGCGWASVKYRGRKLDAYKNVWYRKKKEERNQEFDGSSELEHLIQTTMTNSMQYHRIVVKHNTIANRTLTQ